MLPRVVLVVAAAAALLIQPASAQAAIDANAVVPSVRRPSSVAAGSGWKGPGSPVKLAFDFDPTYATFVNDPVVDSSGNVYISMATATAGVQVVVALNGKTGGQIWQYKSTDASYLGLPVPTSYGIIIVGTTKGAIGITTATGALAWTFTDSTTTFLPSHVDLFPTGNGVIIAGRGTATGGKLASINGQTGAVQWTAATTSAQSDTLIYQSQVLLAYPGIDVDASTITIYSYAASNGALVWQAQLDAAMSLTLFLFALDGAGNAVVGWGASSTVKIASINLGNKGSVTWQQQSTLTDWDPFGYVGPANAYLGTNTAIVAYNLRTGAKSWTANFGLTSKEFPVMAVQGTTAYCVTGPSTQSVNFTALDDTTGLAKWSFQDPDAKGLFGTPVFDTAGNIFVESFSTAAGSTVYALSPSGALLWKYGVNPSSTIYVDTGLALGNGMLYLGDNLEVIGLSGSTSTGLSSGAVAAAVVVPILGVAGIAAAVWYFKFKRPATVGFTAVGSGGYTASTV